MTGSPRSVQVARSLIESFPDVPPLSQLLIELEHRPDNQGVNRLDLSHPASVGAVRPALNDRGHRVTQPSGRGSTLGQINPTQRMERGEQLASVGNISHHRLLTAARAATRYVAAALLLLALQQLQSKAVARRAADARPSGTTQGGAS